MKFGCCQFGGFFLFACLLLILFAFLLGFGKKNEVIFFFFPTMLKGTSIFRYWETEIIVIHKCIRRVSLTWWKVEEAKALEMKMLIPFFPHMM